MVSSCYRTAQTHCGGGSAGFTEIYNVANYLYNLSGSCPRDFLLISNTDKIIEPEKKNNAQRGPHCYS